ncbi:MAG: RsmB/NOP family class I SAM-dependent RNA methyltransferase [Lachnospiraceae bacterium]|nr:RsmB/NOP family class I SAM-dependent RNA methyltransferase [Lachnospiraceae bacterium]
MKQEDKVVLPEAFIERMQRLLGEEYTEFLASYEKERLYGLRYNPLKTDRETFLAKMPFSLEKVMWAQEGFYYQAEQQPGKHPFHEAGAYYIQEPSAMSVVEVLDPKPGEKILDLCAAPGGKSTQIAGRMAGQGLLITNEIIPNRAKILSQNVERMGIGNAVVCNETPDRLAAFFPNFFDKIIVDAPCSGEGMFRKDDTAIREWSLEHVQMCADRQQMILEEAAKMLKPGGILVYSTCTFAPAENEGAISAFIEKHEDFEIEEVEQERFFSPGEKAWTENPAEGIEHTMRLWPHKIDGEGHFIARLKKTEGLCSEVCLTIGEETERGHSKGSKGNKGNKGNKGSQGGRNEIDSIQLCKDFLRKELILSEEKQEKLEEKAVYVLFGEQVYLVPKQMIPLRGIKVVRPGLHLGTGKKNRFEPSHALALYLKSDNVKLQYEMTDAETERYLKGETFACDGALKGWVLLTTHGFSIGFGKAGGGLMKNHYPKGLRKM